MPVYLISASSRGIGLEVVQQLSQDPEAKVIACARNPSNSAALMDIVAKSEGRIETLVLDVTDQASIKASVGKISELSIVKSNNGAIDVLLNIAGTMSCGFKPATTLSVEELELDTKTNFHGPILLTLALLPLLALSPPKPLLAKVFVVSSILGSNGNFLNYGDIAAGYSATKAGVNMWFRKLALELQTGVAGLESRKGGWAVCILHPGYVKTEMTRGNGDVVVEESASGLIKTMSGVSESDTGKFLNWRGEVVPW